MTANWQKTVAEISIYAAAYGALMYGVYWYIKARDPETKKLEAAKAKSQVILEKMGFRLKDLNLSEHEQIIASEIIWPDEIKVSFKDIGGLESAILSLKENVIYPLSYPDLFKGLLGPPKGVLLYGPPGCGKTMLAKALAKESGASFINLHVSTLTEKWFGESQKLVRGLFSLAKKLEPTIIFIDEIDSFLRERKMSDHEATAMMKAEFMTLWDGLATGNERVIVLGATNRIGDLDKAILRRMPQRHQISLPDTDQREKVIRLVLKNVNVEKGFDYKNLAEKMVGHSCSDIREMCRVAAMVPIQEAIRYLNDTAEPGEDISKKDVFIRALSITDFPNFLDNLFTSHTDTLSVASLE